MQLSIPEAETINLISSLEDGSCTIARSERSGLSALTPRAAYDVCGKGIDLRKHGDLVGSNEAFIEMFHLKNVLNNTALLAWAKTLLLAKDFRHAQLLMHAQFANDYRETAQFDPFIWMNLHLDPPELEVNHLFDGSSPGCEVHAASYFEDAGELVESIARFGGNDDFWNSAYRWAQMTMRGSFSTSAR